MLDRYLAQVDAGPEFEADYARLGAQRNAKIVGIFVRLWKRDGKAHYCLMIPRVWQAMERDLKHPALAPVAEWFARGLAVETPQGSLLVHADLVIGADGLHSNVARWVGAPEMLSGRHATAVLYSYWQGLPSVGYEWHYAAHASVGAIPTNDGAHCVFVSFPADRLAQLPGANATDKYEHLLRGFASLAPLMSEAQRVETVRGFGGHRGFLKRSTGPGWALVGDAGYFKDPLTAHGITDALRDADLLVRAVIGANDGAFAEFETVRHELSQRLFEITDQVASFQWTESELQSLHRAFSTEMARETHVLASLEPTWRSPLASVRPVA
jgi:2-polyprenyl-6-methoxyphenol hydroxylase-like FAD-dependent oxidoreductase